MGQGLFSAFKKQRKIKKFKGIKNTYAMKYPKLVENVFNKLWKKIKNE